MCINYIFKILGIFIKKCNLKFINIWATLNDIYVKKNCLTSTHFNKINVKNVDKNCNLKIKMLFLTWLFYKKLFSKSYLYSTVK